MELLLSNLLKPLVIGFFIGTAIGLTGIGGGVLVMPSQIYLLGISPVPAVGTGLLFALLTKLRGVIEHLRLKNVDMKTSLFFVIGSAPATIISSRLVNYFSESEKFPELDNFLQYTMGSILILTAILLVVENVFIRDERKETGNTHGLWRDQKEAGSTTGRKIGCILAGALSGTLIGATSIGGGVLLIPILMIFFRLSAAITVGTSILISLVCAIAGSTVYLLSQNINLPLLLPMFLGSWPGVVIGSRLTARIPERVLKILLMIAIVSGIITFFWGARN